MRSIVLEVRQAVIDGVADALSDERVSVTYGWQGDDDDSRREQVFTSGARGPHDIAGMKSGRLFRDERMEFGLVILVLGVGLKPEEADARALEIGQVVEEFVADHKSNELGITGLKWLRISNLELSPNRVNANGAVAEATYTIRYEARLT
jgi:hypothetical protein